MKVRAQQGETLDALCWRVYGRTAGALEAALEANPDLAELGPILPHGRLIELPDLPPQPAYADPDRRIQLWD